MLTADRSEFGHVDSGAPCFVGSVFLRGAAYWYCECGGYRLLSLDASLREGAEDLLPDPGHGGGRAGVLSVQLLLSTYRVPGLRLQEGPM